MLEAPVIAALKRVSLVMTWLVKMPPSVRAMRGASARLYARQRQEAGLRGAGADNAWGVSEALRKAKEALPNNYRVMLNYAEVLVQQTNYAEALKVLEACKKINPQAGAPYFWQATIAVTQDDSSLACALFARGAARGHQECKQQVEVYCNR